MGQSKKKFQSQEWIKYHTNYEHLLIRGISGEQNRMQAKWYEKIIS